MPDELNHAEPERQEGAWAALATAVPGLAHLEAAVPLPCQDAAAAAGGRRPVVIVADGAGSSPASDRGAQVVVTAMLRLLDTLEAQVGQLLDSVAPPESADGQAFARMLVKHAQGVLQDQATVQRRPARDLRCTLLLVVVGHSRLLWLKVGDGALVVEQAVPAETSVDAGEPGLMPGLMPDLSTLGEPGKGEFANQTVFVDEKLAPEQVQWGCRGVTQVTGVVAMSDGAAEKLVSLDGDRVSGQLSHWLDDLRRSRLRQRDLVRLFYSDTFCRGTNGDDRSIALASRDLPPYEIVQPG
ncbi:protein phosphatase 2C domain-containing protein [Halomonas sp. DQ26W]|uniref:PP2C family serine/threonine-protein phosphatase n=1 Tax=Halomonas sp. DQ26W TaxID=2282311 RepID=UPI000DF7BE52|nr:PP2C family serine/threonine-protein phosphatase [Halomonas sp. DQ26W]RDB44899.1 protein phosphatase 2C domain-containing protein [Halomonas sp. DQ26W]